MMRKSVWLVMAVFLVSGMGSARAQGIIVTDPQSITNSLKQLLQLAKEYDQLVKEYQLLQNVPKSFGKVFQDFGTVKLLRNPLPTYERAAAQIAGAVQQVTLTDYGLIFYNRNQYKMDDAHPPTDPVGQSLEYRTYSLANIQGIAAENLHSITERLNRLEGMEEQLTEAKDVTQIASINGRIAIENQAIQAQAAAAQNLHMMAQAQMENRRIQEREAARVDEKNAADWWRREK